MPVHLVDSLIYQNAWGTAELRDLFDDVPRTRCWLEMLAVLAETEAEYDLIPRDAAAAIAATCRKLPLDAAFFEEVRAGFEATGHSTLGLIQAVQRRCPGNSGEWLYYGATVQDLTDSWTALVLKQVRAIVARELREIESNLVRLASTHRTTVMAGRTHGQVGLPITFGFKAASWALEIRRHRRRLAEIAPRLEYGQLAGGVGSLSSLGPRALEIQQRFLEKLGLRAPTVSWTASRDTLAEWYNVLTLISASADKIGHEVYNLQRPEIGEVSEGFRPGTVGSITMPHKRNPELSEHLGTLARVVRCHAALVIDSLVHEHERDGRSWKAEWAALAESALACGKLLALLRTLTAHLEIHPARMRRNLEASGAFALSEPVMLALAKHLGKQSAHALVYQVAMRAYQDGKTFKQALLEDEQIHIYLSGEEIEAFLDYERYIGQCSTLVDRTLQELRADDGLD